MDTKKIKLARLSNEILTTGIVVLIVILLNVFVTAFVNRRWDLTATGQYSLAPTTAKILERVKEKPGRLQVTAFFRRYPMNSDEKLKDDKTLDLLREYHLRSGKKIAAPRVIDPDQNPAEVARLGVRNVGTVAFEWSGGDPPKEVDGQNTRLVYPRDIWGLRMIDGKPGPPEFRGENAFSSALLYLLDPKVKTICIMQGHGEPLISSKEKDGLKDVKAEFERNGFAVRAIDLVQIKAVPADCNVVMIAGPRQVYTPQEVVLLNTYLQAGGGLLLLAEFNVEAGLARIYEALGVELGKNLVIDVHRSFFGRPTSPIPLFGEHDIVRDMKAAGMQVILNTVRSVERALGDTRGIKTTDLLLSSETAWAEADYEAGAGKQKEVAFNAGSRDLKGPVTMAMAVTKTLGETTPNAAETRAVVVGDADFAQNENLQYGANRDFLLASLLWLLGDEGGIALAPKDPVFNFVTITNRQIWVVFAIVVILLPGVVLAIGVFQWWERRSL